MLMGYPTLSMPCFYRLFGDGEKKKKYASDHISSVNDTINIFSVASGHLYERFIRWDMNVVVKY